MSNKITKQIDNLIPEIEQFLKNGLSVKEIAIQIGFKYASVYNGIIRNGLKKYVSVKNNGKSKTSVEYQTRIRNQEPNELTLRKLYHEEKKDLYEIAILYNKSPSGILWKMKTFNILTRDKTSAMKLAHIKNPNIAEKHRINANNGIIGIFKKGNNYSNSKIEQLFGQWCDTNKISYIKQFQLRNGGHRYDFYLNNSNLLIELDGNYWHNKIKQIPKDQQQEIDAITEGYKVIRFKDDEIIKTKCKCFERLYGEINAL